MSGLIARLVKRFNAAFPRQKDGFDSRISLFNCRFAKIAQLVEQRYRKPWVRGSNPLLGSVNPAPGGIFVLGCLSGQHHQVDGE